MMGMEWGRKDYILNRCRDKTVLHVGCVDEGNLAERLANGNLFHKQIEQVARNVVGIDISREGIKILKDAGFTNLIEMDICREVPQGKFDIVVVPEVLEHLSNPGLALDILAQVDTDEYIFSVVACHVFCASRRCLQTRRTSGP